MTQADREDIRGDLLCLVPAKWIEIKVDNQFKIAKLQKEVAYLQAQAEIADHLLMEFPTIDAMHAAGVR